MHGLLKELWELVADNFVIGDSVLFSLVCKDFLPIARRVIMRKMQTWKTKSSCISFPIFWSDINKVIYYHKKRWLRLTAEQTRMNLTWVKTREKSAKFFYTIYAGTLTYVPKTATWIPEDVKNKPRPQCIHDNEKLTKRHWARRQKWGKYGHECDDDCTEYRACSCSNPEYFTNSDIIKHLERAYNKYLLNV
jgi:hypothetical protein